MTPQQAPRAAVGAAPEGARDQRSAAKAVQQMFSDVAPRYDLLNHVLSCNVDRIWWWRAARITSARFRSPKASPRKFQARDSRRAGNAENQIVGADFVHAMLVRAAPKTVKKNVLLLEGDALQLPVGDATFDLVTSAFGFRNLANYDAGLQEIHRVLISGGEVGILDFSEPKGLLGKIYRLYFRHILPRIGSLISGVRGPYAYLPASVERFPEPTEMLGRMQAAGFSEVSWTPYSFGIAGLFRGKKL